MVVTGLPPQLYTHKPFEYRQINSLVTGMLGFSGKKNAYINAGWEQTFVQGEGSRGVLQNARRVRRMVNINNLTYLKFFMISLARLKKLPYFYNC